MAEVFSLHTLELHRGGEALLDVIVKEIPGLSKGKARTAILSGLVSLNELTVSDVHLLMPDQPAVLKVDLRHGLELPIEKQLARRPFKILHIDKDLVVVDKAAGILASQPHRLEDEKTKDSHLADIVGRTLKKMGKDIHYVGYVHRLDQDTSGCICLALTKDAHRHLAEQFATKEANRVYRCIVTGQPVQDSDTLRGIIVRGSNGRRRLVREELPGEHGEKAVTEFTVLERFDGGADCEVRLLTGRTHQVRVSMAAIGAPVFGDPLYGEKTKKAPRMMLHAWKLTLTHPKTEKIMTFEAPLPKQFSECRPPKSRGGARLAVASEKIGFDEDRSGEMPYRPSIHRGLKNSKGRIEYNGDRSKGKVEHNGDRFKGKSEHRDSDRSEGKFDYNGDRSKGKSEQGDSHRSEGQDAPRYKNTRAERPPKSQNAEPARATAKAPSERAFGPKAKTVWKENPKRLDKPRDSVQYGKKTKPTFKNDRPEN
jgi:23S rRNA pseudouridine1911/1915/1917 synthase